MSIVSQSLERKWGLSSIDLFFFFFCFLRKYISYKQCIENKNKKLRLMFAITLDPFVTKFKHI